MDCSKEAECHTYHCYQFDKLKATRVSVRYLICHPIERLMLIPIARSYKVVRPEWITESIQAQQLLPWQQYRLVPRATAQRQLVFNSKDEAPPPVATVAAAAEAEASATAVEKITGETLNAHVLSNDWARQISTANPTFIKRYYETSRLHYLSSWKAELKDIVEQLEEKYKSDPSMLSRKRKRMSASYTRVVMHVDFDCFFASVGIKDRPHLKELPVCYE